MGRWTDTVGSSESTFQKLCFPFLRFVVDSVLSRANSISKHKDAATAAQRREEQLQSELAVLSESATVGLARIDLDGKMVTVNKVCR